MNRVKELCIRRDIKQKELAAAIGVSQPTVSDWFNNKTDPSGERLEKLSKYLRVSVAVILGYDDDPLAPAKTEDDFYPRPQSTPPLMLDGGDVNDWPKDDLDLQLRDEWVDLPDEIKKSTIAFIKFQKYGTKE